MQNNKVFIPAKIKTMLDNMNLSDRFLFNETVEDPEIYNIIVEILMDEHISMLSWSETEKELRVSPQLREIRLDVIGMDDEGALYPELKLNDGAKRIFINTNGTNSEEFSQEFLDFMEYINQSTDTVAEKTDSIKIRQIHNRVCRKLSKGLPPEQIADHLETDISQILKICETASSYAPDYDTASIIQELLK